MPYRRLPNTDIARLKALKTALAAGVEIPPFKLAFAQSTLQKMRNFFTPFEQMMQQQKSSFVSQSAKSKELGIITRKAKLYISHFYQVLNFAIMRGELTPSARKFYGLKENDSKIPNLNSEKDIVFWGEKLIKGESERISSGGNPITNPTSAVVRVRYEQFLEAVHYQKVLQKTTNFATDKISAMRAEADQIILNVWNEVEETFDLLPEDIRREKASKYGVTYVYRPHERDELQQIPEDIVNDFVNEQDVFTQAELQSQRRNILQDEEEKENNEQLQYSISFSHN
ncbi:MAG TPA: hypothetical protein DCE80_19550, partial [Ignavibacteriales bacterium]|nr:MAG: hypothetical protein A2X08_06400 [Bacteroidetes bacterium GWA2_32_17]HAB54344.1 hypothetical protein [Ignavibacteriales bacterium]